jgi:hypothetical protein
MLLSVHIAEVGFRKAVTAVLRTPKPNSVQGLRYARSWLMTPLRMGMLPTPRSTGVLMLAAWDDDESLDKFLSHRRAALYRDGWRTRMIPARSIGALPGLPDLPRRELPTGDHPVVAFTRGRIKMGNLIPYFAAAAAAEREAQTHPAYIEGTSLIRLPLEIGTFTLWRNASEMKKYSIGNYPGGHKNAMVVERKRPMMKEMLFSRHLPYSAEGQWNGRNPLGELSSPDYLDLIKHSLTIREAADAASNKPRKGAEG